MEKIIQCCCSLISSDKIRISQSEIIIDHYAHLPRHKPENREMKNSLDYGQQVKHQTQIKIKIFHNDVVSLYITNK